MQKKEVSSLRVSRASLLWARLQAVGSDSSERYDVVEEVKAIAATCKDGTMASLEAIDLLEPLLFQPLAYNNETEGMIVNGLMWAFLRKYGYGIGRVGFQGEVFPQGYERDPRYLRRFLLEGNLVARSTAAMYAESMTYYPAMPWIERALIDCRHEVATGTSEDDGYRHYMVSSLLYLRGARHEGIPCSSHIDVVERGAILERQREREKVN